MKRGIIPPVPIEFFGPQDSDTINLWKLFFLASEEDRNRWADISFLNMTDMAFFPRVVVGMAKENCIEELWYPEPFFSSMLRKAADKLKSEGIRTVAFKYPPIRNLDFLKKSVSESLKILGMTESDIETRLQAWNPLRIAIKKLDGVQTRSLALGNMAYVETLHSILDPTESLPQLLRIAETKVALKMRNFDKEPYLRIGIVEITPYLKSFYSVLEKYGAAIVYDELGLENFPLGHFTDISYLYSQITFPLGIKARKDRIEKEIKDRGIDGLIYGTFNSAEIKSNADYFEREFKTPVFIYEIKQDEKKTAVENNLLERFLSTILQKRGEER
ncbi:MAG: 2-hydroxyacyl-CoA dehydratase family protein [Acidobacteria bacterium]|nr:2-hydroxyacyl-CoA dehydratase family protein [Acidobacteriota bacterium]